MPEFILDLGDSAREFSRLDSFTQGYIEAMFFTSTGDGDNAENGLQDASFSELAPETLENIIADCRKFQRDNAQELDSVYGVVGKHERFPYDESRAGNDYWYTRNGHGTGFWDRGLDTIGDALAKAARYSERYLYRGDDGLIYLG
jgi:hypothetical protein